eukprot:SAG22_NODE_8243_length_671_cov_1.342657_1_plen_48_part_10
MAGVEPEAVPLVDYSTLAADRPQFVRACGAAMRDVGFMLLENVDGLAA